MSTIKNFFSGQVQFRVQGLPHECLNKLRKFSITDISCDNDVIVFSSTLKHLNSIKKLISNFEYQIKENYNIFRGINFLLNHFVLVIAVLVAAISYFIADTGIYAVKVQCDNLEILPAVNDHLDTLGVKKFMWKKQVNDLDLANNLIQNFDNIAHANVTIAGNTLLVNLVTATNETKPNKTNFYAQYDAVITEITAYSGTALVTVGDVVKKGDLLVANAYPNSVVVTGEVAFANDDKISRLVIWII